MKRAYSDNVLRAKFEWFDFDGEWLEAIGRPERTGTWIIYGAPKQGKTTFAMLLGKYLTQFCRVAYNSIEEGLSLSIQNAFRRVEMRDAGSRFILLDREPTDELVKRLEMRRSPHVIFIDSIQFSDVDFLKYRELKNRFKDKIFIYISHVDGNQPDGATARRIWRDANLAFRVDRFMAFPTGRFGGGSPIPVDREQAAELWGMQL